MERYVALLRGVNVGGKNKVPMSLLKAAFEEAGYADVLTYINSGNILFSCKEEDPLFLQQMGKKIIMDSFRLDIPIAVLSASDYSLAMSKAPDWWDKDKESKQIAIFVIAPQTANTMVKEVQINPEYEKIAAHGQVIFWTAPLKTFSRTRWSKVVTTSAYRHITIRNARTTKKIQQLLEL